MTIPTVEQQVKQPEAPKGFRTTASGLLVPDSVPERLALPDDVELMVPSAQRKQQIQEATPEELTMYANDQNVFAYPPYFFGSDPLTQQTIIPFLASPNILKQLNKTQRSQLAFFAKYFFEKLIIIEGKKGSGKSQMAIALAYKLRRMFNLPVLADQILFPKFGPYKYFSEADLVDSLTQITSIVKQMNDDQAAGAVQWAMRKHGIMVMNAVILLDEAYKYFERQTSSNKLVRLFGYFIAEMRHYHCTVIICVPSRRYITTRVQDQVDILAKVAFDKEQEKVFAMLLDYQSGDFHSIDVDSRKYRDMYDSWGAVGLRKNILNVGKDLA